MKHFTDLTRIPRSRLEEDLKHWQGALKEALTERGKANAKEIIAEIEAELESRKQSA